MRLRCGFASMETVWPVLGSKIIIAVRLHRGTRGTRHYGDGPSSRACCCWRG
jgi:hypothetical protein